MNKLVTRFLKYAAFDTTSDSRSETAPSTAGQLKLAEFLAAELRSIGAERIRLTKAGYVFAEIPASDGFEHLPVLGLIAHLDTSEDASGAGVKPQIVPYAGGVLPLGKSGRVLDPAQFPELNRLSGKTLITTDGTTLLGGDDKAGIAEIMSAAELLIHGGILHGPIRIAFTPDEEIGRGTDHFDLAEFGADYAYTADGTEAGLIEYCNFNAGLADFKIRGVSVHPGSAYGIMKNALRIGAELVQMLPAEESPERTRGREGFYHPISFCGGTGSAEVQVIVRDHDAGKFEEKHVFVQKIAETLNRKYGEGTVTLCWREQYRNMEEVIRKVPFLVEIAREAMIRAGVPEPQSPPIRGGTDGAMLSLRGLPCPNLSTGAYNCHGELEYVCVEEMEQAVQILLNIAELFASGKFFCKNA